MGNFFYNLKLYIREYKWELFLTICMFSNLYKQLPEWLYYVDWLAFIYVIKKYHSKQAKSRSIPLWSLIILICATTFLSGIIEYRFAMMCLILYLTLGTTSFRFYQFKVRFLFVSMIGYVFTALLNFYAHLAGINMRSWSSYDAMIDFSGFTWQGMWLGAACGIANIYILYKFYHFHVAKQIKLSIIYLVILFTSVMVTIWAGSRSGLAASVIGMGCLLLFITKKMKKSLQLIIGFSMVVMLLFPFLKDNATRIMDKEEYQDKIGRTSRDELWGQRIEEFKSSPIIGVGFGVYGVGENVHGGKTESGSGWLAVLSQTGIIGFILVVLLVKKGFMPIKEVRKNERVAFLTALLIFLTTHTVFEGYLFQSGWYLCFVVWLIVGILDDYKKYKVMEFEDFKYF